MGTRTVLARNTSFSEIERIEEFPGGGGRVDIETVRRKQKTN